MNLSSELEDSNDAIFLSISSQDFINNELNDGNDDLFRNISTQPVKKRKKLDVGSVDSLYSNELNDGNDDLFANVATQPVNNSLGEIELNDGMDDLLNRSYEKVKYRIEPFVPPLLEKEKKKQELLAKCQLIETKRRWNLVGEMNDYFFSLESWPVYALELIMTSEFTYNERLSLATFLFGNGLNDEHKALRIFQYYNQSWSHSRQWHKRFLEFQMLFPYLKQTTKQTDIGRRLRAQYFYFDIQTNLTMFFDGSVRMMNGEKRPYKLNRYN